MFESVFLSWLFFSFLVLIPLLYWYLTRNYDYFTKQGIKGPKPLLLFGNFLDQFKLKLIEREELYSSKYGRIYGTFNGTTPKLNISDPELIKQILVKDFNKFSGRAGLGNVEHEIHSLNMFVVKGEQWRKIRSLVSPTFTSGKMKKMQSLVKEILNLWLNELDKNTANGTTEVDIKKIFGGLTMEVIARVAFATKMNTIKEPDHPFIQNANKMLAIKPKNALPAFILPKFINNMLGIHSIFDNNALTYMYDLCKSIIEQRKTTKMNEQSTDFLQLLLNAQNVDENYHDDDDKYDAHHINQGEEDIKLEKKILFSKRNQGKLTDNEIMAQVLIFFVAGYETTATTLTWIAYELSLNQSVQQRLYEEVMTAVNEKGEFDYDTLAKLPYLDAVVSETLRMHNPATRLNRICEEQCVLNGIKIDKGVNIDICVHAVQHDEQFFPNAKLFDPERFLPENRHKIKPYTYLPFGAGPRSCVGMRFALMETKIVLAYLVRKFKFTKSPNTPVPPNTIGPLFLNSPKTMLINVQKR